MGGGSLGDSGNARKKTFFFLLMSSLNPTRQHNQFQCLSNTDYVFPNFSIKERRKMREKGDSVFGYPCGHVEGNAGAIVDCIEELAYNLSSVVKTET